MSRLRHLRMPHTKAAKRSRHLVSRLMVRVTRLFVGNAEVTSLYIVERRNVSPLAPMTTVYTFTMPAGAKSRARIKCWNARKVHAPAYAWNYSIVGEVRS